MCLKKKVSFKFDDETKCIEFKHLLSWKNKTLTASLTEWLLSKWLQLNKELIGDRNEIWTLLKAIESN